MSESRDNPTAAQPGDPHPATLDGEALLRQCQVRRFRTRGPGGQHRNKVETAVEIVHKPTGVTAYATERRSLGDNQRVALFRLRVDLALAIRRPIDPLQPPSAMWRSRLEDGVIRLNPAHHDFPAMLAEAMDTLEALQADVRRAAAALNCSPSQIVKLLQNEPRAIEWLNARRRHHGLREMK